MNTARFVQFGARRAGQAGIVAALVAGALGASTAGAHAEVIAGTETGWGAPPGGVMLSVVEDDGSGNHVLSLTWDAIDPIPGEDGDGGYWQCTVDERSTSTRVDHHDGRYTSNEPLVHVNFDVKLEPATGGSYRRSVTEAPGERIALSLTCRTVYPGSFPTTPPSPPFGWKFEYQLRSRRNSRPRSRHRWQRVGIFGV